MKDFIQLDSNGYTVRISLKNIKADLICNLITEIQTNDWNWFNFSSCDDYLKHLWYNDGSSCLECIRLDKVEKVIEFE